MASLNGPTRLGRLEQTVSVGVKLTADTTSVVFVYNGNEPFPRPFMRLAADQSSVIFSNGVVIVINIPKGNWIAVLRQSTLSFFPDGYQHFLAAYSRMRCVKLIKQNSRLMCTGSNDTGGIRMQLSTAAVCCITASEAVASEGPPPFSVNLSLSTMARKALSGTHAASKEVEVAVVKTCMSKMECVCSPCGGEDPREPGRVATAKKGSYVRRLGRRVYEYMSNGVQRELVYPGSPSNLSVFAVSPLSITAGGGTLNLMSIRQVQPGEAVTVIVQVEIPDTVPKLICAVELYGALMNSTGNWVGNTSIVLQDAILDATKTVTYQVRCNQQWTTNYSSLGTLGDYSWIGVVFFVMPLNTTLVTSCSLQRVTVLLDGYEVREGTKQVVVATSDVSGQTITCDTCSTMMTVPQSMDDNLNDGKTGGIVWLMDNHVDADNHDEVAATAR